MRLIGYVILDLMTLALQLAKKALLFKIFLAIFTFLIAKIAMREQQLYQVGYIYLFLFFGL